MPRGCSLILVLAASLGGLAVAGPSQAQSRCPGLLPQVSYRLDMRPAEFSHERTMAELRGMTNARTSSHPLGLYVTSLVGGPVIEPKVTRVDDRDCVAIAKVDIRFEMRSRVIYIAREIDRNSCVYRVALDHERQHERIDEERIRQQLPKNVGEMRYDFSNLATSAPVRAAERDQIIRDYRDRAQAIVNRMLDGLLEEREKAQLSIDTPQEYARLAALCR